MSRLCGATAIVDLNYLVMALALQTRRKRQRDNASYEFQFAIHLSTAIARTLGFDLVASGNRGATIEIVTDTAKHANPMGTIGCEQPPSAFT